MEKIRVASGIYWVGIPEANLYILCGCPADSVKHLMKMGLIVTKEKNGTSYETGPNAILLSDINVQNGSFANLAEFPVLQMFYRQGLIIPGHINNTGLKPMLIGIDDQVRAQSEYIFRGNYGLVSEEEIIAAGVDEDTARDMMRLKLKFAFGNIMKTEEMLDTRTVGPGKTELRDGVFIERTAFNVYRISHEDRSVTVDLNLPPGEEYHPPYTLGFHETRKEYFSVIHIGEGDGWDVNRPCMSSILMFQGKIYLLDAGPHIQHALTALGISINEIEGIIHTHCHDDHFAGLTSLVRSDHMIKYYATELVRASVVKKFTALMNTEEERFYSYFETHDLETDSWNSIDGLEVRPIFSPHPVETTIMLFRAVWEGGYKTYAHWADTVSLDVLEGMITDDRTENGVSRELFENVKRDYLIPVDIKKIDIGGGMIHGMAKDFVEDESDRIILCHIARPLTGEEKAIGSNAVFGMQDVLIPARVDYLERTAREFLRSYFPDVPEHDIEMFLNCPIESINPGSILIKNGTVNENIYLIVSGVMEYIEDRTSNAYEVSAGSIIGELSGLMSRPISGTYRAGSYVRTLRFSSEQYLEFVKANDLYDSIRRIHDTRQYLKNTFLFGEMVSYLTHNNVSKYMAANAYPAGKNLPTDAPPQLYMLLDGKLEVNSNGKVLENISPGGFFGEEKVLCTGRPVLEARAVEDSIVFHLPEEIIKTIPIVRWKMLETLERRLMAIGTQCELKRSDA